MVNEPKKKRLTRNQARTARRIRRNRNKRFIRGAVISGISIVAILLIVSLFLPSVQFGSGNNTEDSENFPGTSFPVQGNNHIEVGEVHPPYNTIPPTSGWHYDTPAPWAVSNQPIPNEIQVANLEKGGVLLQYNCPNECDEIVQNLNVVASRYPHTIVAPYPTMNSKIALTAWGWIDKFDEYNEDRIFEFIEAHINNGPGSE